MSFQCWQRLLRGCLRPSRGLGWPLRNLSQPLGAPNQPLRSLRGGMDARTYIWTDVQIPPCILQDFVPSGSHRGRCPKKLMSLCPISQPPLHPHTPNPVCLNLSCKGSEFKQGLATKLGLHHYHTSVGNFPKVNLVERWEALIRSLKRKLSFHIWNDHKMLLNLGLGASALWKRYFFVFFCDFLGANILTFLLWWRLSITTRPTPVRCQMTTGLLKPYTTGCFADKVYFSF